MQCLEWYAAVAGSQRDCSKLDEWMVGECRARVQARRSSRCEGIRSPVMRTGCLHDRALASGDPSVCDALPDQRLRTVCKKAGPIDTWFYAPTQTLLRSAIDTPFEPSSSGCFPDRDIWWDINRVWN